MINIISNKFYLLINYKKFTILIKELPKITNSAMQTPIFNKIINKLIMILELDPIEAFPIVQ